MTPCYTVNKHFLIRLSPSCKLLFPIKLVLQSFYHNPLVKKYGICHIKQKIFLQQRHLITPLGFIPSIIAPSQLNSDSSSMLSDMFIKPSDVLFLLRFKYLSIKFLATSNIPKSNLCLLYHNLNYNPFYLYNDTVYIPFRQINFQVAKDKVRLC